VYRANDESSKLASHFLPEDGAMPYLRRRWGRTASLCVLLAASISCRRKHDEQTGAGATATPAAVSNTATAGAPQVVGGTAAALHAYLTTVDTVRGATFEVSWRPETVRLDRATTTRTLQGVSPDGATFRFADDPALGAVKPGAVLLVWGVALRRVDSVTSNGGALVVHTSVASLTDAIDHGHIAFQGPADFAHGVVAPTYLKPDSLKVSMGSQGGSGFEVRPVSYVRGEELSRSPEGTDNEGGRDPVQGDQAGGDSTGDSTAIPNATANIKKGEIKGFEYEVAYLYTGGGLDFEMEVTKKPEEAPSASKEGGKEDNKEIVQGLKDQQAGKPEVPPPAQGNPDPNPLATAIRASMKANKAWSDAKENWDRKTQDIPSAVWASLPALTSGKLWGTVYNTLDLRVKAQGHIDGLDLGGDISIANAKQIASKLSINNLNGLVNLQYIARLGDQQGTWDEQLKAMLPVTFNIPMIIGGIPFMFQVGVNLYAVPGLSLRDRTGHGPSEFRGQCWPSSRYRQCECVGSVRWQRIRARGRQ
jgi:hypothetical protein